MVLLLELFILHECVLPPCPCLLGIIDITIVNSDVRIGAIAWSLLLEHLSVAVLHKGFIDKEVEYLADALLLLDGSVSFLTVGLVHLHVLDILVELGLPSCEVLVHCDHPAVLDTCVLSVLRAVAASLHGFIDIIHAPVEVGAEDLPSAIIVL